MKGYASYIQFAQILEAKFSNIRSGSLKSTKIYSCVLNGTTSHLQNKLILLTYNFVISWLKTLYFMIG